MMPRHSPAATREMIDVVLVADEPSLRRRRASADILPLAQVGRYVLLRRLGRGGMGEVFRAYDPATRREVAIKVARDDPEKPARAKRRREALVLEGRAMARIFHPHIVSVYEAQVLDDACTSYVAMELIEGIPLCEWWHVGRPTEKEVLTRVLELLSAISTVHQTGLIHRDLKPENILVSPTRGAVLLDFGLALEANLANSDDPRAARFRRIAGTPYYMAPEQMRSEEFDVTADCYAIGLFIIDYFLQRHLFSRTSVTENAAGKRRLRTDEPPANWRHGARLWQILAKAIMPARQHRYRSAQAFANELEDYLQRPSGSSRWFLAAALAACASTAALLGVSEDYHASCDQLRTIYRPQVLRFDADGPGQVQARHTPTTDQQARHWLASFDELCTINQEAQMVSRSGPTRSQVACLAHAAVELNAIDQAIADMADKSALDPVSLSQLLIDPRRCTGYISDDTELGSPLVDGQALSRSLRQFIAATHDQSQFGNPLADFNGLWQDRHTHFTVRNAALHVQAQELRRVGKTREEQRVESIEYFLALSQGNRMDAEDSLGRLASATLRAGDRAADELAFEMLQEADRFAGTRTLPNSSQGMRLNAWGTYWISQERYDAAISRYLSAAAAFEEQDAEGAIPAASAYNNAAYGLAQIGELSAAASIYGLAISQLSELSTTPASELLAPLSNRAAVLDALGRLPEVRDMLRRSIMLATPQQVPDARKRAIVLSQYADYLAVVGNDAEALNMLAGARSALQLTPSRLWLLELQLLTNAQNIRHAPQSKTELVQMLDRANHALQNTSPGERHQAIWLYLEVCTSFLREAKASGLPVLVDRCASEIKKYSPEFAANKIYLRNLQAHLAWGRDDSETAINQLEQAIKLSNEHFYSQLASIRMRNVLVDWLEVCGNVEQARLQRDAIRDELAPVAEP